MSNSNIGARKNRNIRDHTFVINAILNDAINGPNKSPIDIQIFGVSNDKLEFVSTMNNLCYAGVQNDKAILIANSNKELKRLIPTSYSYWILTHKLAKFSL